MLRLPGCLARASIAACAKVVRLPFLRGSSEAAQAGDFSTWKLSRQMDIGHWRPGYWSDWYEISTKMGVSSLKFVTFQI